MMLSSDSLFEPEITRNPTTFEFYTRAFIARTSESTSSPFSKNSNFAYSFTYDREKHRASLSLLKRKLWHLETGKRYRSKAVTFGKLFTNSLIHLDFLPFEQTGPSFITCFNLWSVRRSIRISLSQVNKQFLIRPWFRHEDSSLENWM